MSRDIDYVYFWDNKDLKLLEDEYLIKTARKGLEEFENEYKELKEILSRYPKLYNEDTYCYENAKWIYIHLVTRCFGKYLAYVTMVPFAEMLNHECIYIYLYIYFNIRYYIIFYFFYYS